VRVSCPGQARRRGNYKELLSAARLDILKQERTRETWLLKNDLKNLEKANSELQQQLKEQQAEYQEQLKAEKKAHQGRPSLLSSTFP
jgi:hypothetical protein